MIVFGPVEILMLPGGEVLVVLASDAFAAILRSDVVRVLSCGYYSCRGLRLV